MNTRQPPSAAPLARHAMAYVLAGGRGSRLMELTDKRAKPAVYFGGKARIIDFALSNALNSGIRRIAVATQYKAHSLIRHLQRGWNFFRPERNESFDILPASQRVSEQHWYRGTADAVFQNIDIVESYAPRYIILLAGDHVYKMDYEHMLQQPADPAPMHDKPGHALCSMGIYVFESEFLFEILREDAADPHSTHDFGQDIIPKLVRDGLAWAHHFSRSCVRSHAEAEPYWRDVGTLDAYFTANIDLTDVVPGLDLYDRDWPIWTFAEMTAPAKFVHDLDGRRGIAVSSLVAGGCIISGAALKRSLVFTGVRVHSFATVNQTVILPGVVVGRGARLNKVIIDRGVRIPDGLVVGEDPDLDAKRFRRTANGVCLITESMVEGLS